MRGSPSLFVRWPSTSSAYKKLSSAIRLPKYSTIVGLRSSHLVWFDSGICASGRRVIEHMFAGWCLCQLSTKTVWDCLRLLAYRRSPSEDMSSSQSLHTPCIPRPFLHPYVTLARSLGKPPNLNRKHRPKAPKPTETLNLLP